ncbi:type III secretion system chaperone family protein [Salininema proteolyticum]|uniref:YbjN domain-containing protein n=1 Tax=Salininema proteolyticum TaxID=1607685 RepID=A0ABV8TW91_9ACTN
MLERLTAALEEMGVDWRPLRSYAGQKEVPGAVVTLPGTKKLNIACSLVVEDHALRVESFVARRPEENFEGVAAELLRRNGRLFGVAFAVDESGDVHLVGRLPLSSVNAEDLDRLLGTVLEAADETFNVILELGFASSIRQEWEWRLAHGESTRNLEAFQHLKPRGDH